ncbi:hypothetical protein [Nonomuraea sp. NPDC059022]|uniref:hypothetical protein n=1 Tax=Nonomuraea sp. NPDC059022 TaxID=3346705 RepID=UPI0036A01D15
MPLVVGTSAPLALGSDVFSTAAFDAPAGALLVAGFAGADGDSVSGGGLTWSMRRESVSGGYVARLWTAPVPTPKPGLQVTVGGDFPQGGFKVWLVSGQDPSPIGASGSGTSAVNNATLNGYTSTREGSLGFCVAYESSINGSLVGQPASTEVSEGFLAGEVPPPNSANAGSGLLLRKAAGAPSAGSPVTFNANAPGTGSASWVWAALEILPPSDVTAPTTPGGLRVTEVTGASLTVAWDASTDAGGVQGYGVYLDGVMVTGP